MSNVTINTLPNIAALATGDKVATWDVSAGIMGYATVAQIRGTGAATDAANTFSAGQTISPSNISDIGLTINLPSGSAGNALLAQLAGVNRFQARVTPALAYMSLFGEDLGNNIAGPYLNVGRNTNATKPGSGFVMITNRAGSAYRVWPDASGNLRIHTADPIYDNDGLGTVIGTQTSMADAKNLLGEVGDPITALRAIIEAAHSGLQRFQYKSGAFNGEIFEGIVTDLAPRYGMDRDSQHPAGKSLNTIQLLGDLVRAVALLAEKAGIT